MARVDDIRRILLVVTERSPLQSLWDVVEEQMDDTGKEVVALFVNDEAWRRAASLPFTREVSRVSGVHREFTEERAAQLDKDTVGRVRSHLRELAARVELEPMFEVLAEREASQIHDYVRVAEDLLITSADLKERPIYNELVQVSCRVVFIETGEQEHE